MTNKEALTLAMGELANHPGVRVDRAKAHAVKDAEDQVTADKFAEAWNMLRHLSTVA